MATEPSATDLGPHGVIYEDEHLIVFHRPGRTPFILCSFGHLGLRPDDQGSFWAMTFAERPGYEMFGIVAKADNWFPAIAMRGAAAAIRDRAGKPLILYGHSMGAYAALKYGTLLGSIGSIASAPMIAIDPAVVPDDDRYHRFFASRLHADMAIAAPDVAGRIVLLFDPYDPADADQAERLKRLIDAEMLYELRAGFFGHECIQLLLDRTIFLAVLGFCFHGQRAPRMAEWTRALKRRNAKYHISFATGAIEKRSNPVTKPRMIGWLAERAVALADDDPDLWSVRVRALQIESRLFLDNGRIDEAIDKLEEAIDLELEATALLEVNMIFRAAGLCMAKGDGERVMLYVSALAGRGAFGAAERAALVEIADQHELPALARRIAEVPVAAALGAGADREG